MYKLQKDGYYRCQEIYKGVRIDLKASSESALFEKVRDKKNKIDSGNLFGSDSMNVRVWSDKWLDTYKKPNVTSATFSIYKTNINKHVLPSIGNMPLADVKSYQLMDILNSQSGKSLSHLNHLKNAITGLFSSAYNNGIIVRNPSVGLVLPRTKSGTHRAITDEEERVLLKVCETHPNALYPLIMLYCGLRPSECLALNAGDIDLDNNIIHVSKAVEKGKRSVKSTKTKSGKRDVPIPNNHLLLDKLKAATENKAPYDKIFTVSTGSEVCYNNALNWWKSIRRTMNIEMGAEVYRNELKTTPLADDFTAYNLRHTYCTNLQRAGVPLNIAKYLMGHSDIQMTANIYAHQTYDQTEAARRMIDDYITGNTGIAAVTNSNITRNVQ